MSEEIKIAVAGTGYVGLSIATLLAQHHPVTAVDVIPEKVETLNRKQSPIQDEYIEKYLKEKELNLTATLDGASAYRDADFIVIAAPTNYDPVKNYFDTHHIEDVIDLVLSVNPRAVMVIKSTVPVGFSERLKKETGSGNIVFSPEFLREGAAIVQYLADQAPEKQLAPANGTMARYRLQEWLTFIGTELHQGFGPLFNPATPADYQPQVRERLLKRLQWMDGQLAGKPYLMGEQFTVADGYLFTVTNWTQPTKLDISGLAHLAVYRERVGARPAVQAAMKAEGLLK